MVLGMQKQKEHVDIEFWHAADLGADLLRGRFSDFSYDVHTHGTACFSLLTRGAIRIKMRGREFTARSGDLYAIEADEPHAGWPLDGDGWALRTLYVDTVYLRSLVGEDSTSGALDLKGPIIRDADLASMLYRVHYCSQVKGSGLQREQHYIAFAERLLERHTGTPPFLGVPGVEDRAVRMAKDFIDHTLTEQVSLVEIARAAELPTYRLYRVFEHSTGMTPHAYQRQARVRLAMDLIRRNRPLGDVAFSTGFADQAHLTRWFRRMMGITPGAYQRSISS
jgi:AraC-like DNA-binding protein